MPGCCKKCYCCSTKLRLLLGKHTLKNLYSSCFNLWHIISSINEVILLIFNLSCSFQFKLFCKSMYICQIVVYLCHYYRRPSNVSPFQPVCFLWGDACACPSKRKYLRRLLHLPLKLISFWYLPFELFN